MSKHNALDRGVLFMQSRTVLLVGGLSLAALMVAGCKDPAQDTLPHAPAPASTTKAPVRHSAAGNENFGCRELRVTEDASGYTFTAMPRGTPPTDAQLRLTVVYHGRPDVKDAKYPGLSARIERPQDDEVTDKARRVYGYIFSLSTGWSSECPARNL